MPLPGENRQTNEDFTWKARFGEYCNKCSAETYQIFCTFKFKYLNNILKAQPCREINLLKMNLIQSKVVYLSVKINSPMSNLTSKAVDGYTFDVRLKLNSYQNIRTTN